MKITKEAIGFFYKIFFSCYIDGKKSSEENRKVIEKIMVEKGDMPFGQFCENLQEWESRKKAIILIKNEMRKEDVDIEVLVNYFGGPEHTKVVVEQLLEDGFYETEKFWRYSIFNHMLIPLKVQKTLTLRGKKAVMGIYENEDVSILVGPLLLLPEDEEKVSIGKMVLGHYPMVVETDPGPKKIEMLFSLQKSDPFFMKAAKSLGRTVDHSEYLFLSVLIRRML